MYLFLESWMFKYRRMGNFTHILPWFGFKTIAKETIARYERKLLCRNGYG